MELVFTCTPKNVSPNMVERRRSIIRRFEEVTSEVLNTAAKRYSGAVPPDLTDPLIRTELPGPVSLELAKLNGGSYNGGTTTSRGRYSLPLIFHRGNGSLVQDVDGNVFIDLCFGLNVTCGHAQPDIAHAAHAAYSSILNTGHYPSVWRVQFSRSLCASMGNCYGSVQLYCSGSEAVEAGLRYAEAIGGAGQLISFRGSYHGKTRGAANLSTPRAGCERCDAHVHQFPYAYCYRCYYGLQYPSCNFQCVEAIRGYLNGSGRRSFTTIVVEPAQGTYVIFPPSGFLERLEALCRERDMVLFCDEVLTGFGRCGVVSLSIASGVTPDILAVGKGLGNGTPISAILAHNRHRRAVSSVRGNTTYGGNPVSVRIASEVLEIQRREGLVARANDVGREIERALLPLWSVRRVGDIRGRGCLFGIEFVEDRETKTPAPDLCEEVGAELARNGVLTFMSGNVLQLVPSLNIPFDLLAEGLRRVLAVVSALAQ